MTDAIQSHRVQQFQQGQWQSKEDLLAGEQALQIDLNDREFLLTMCSPGNEVELCLGLLYSEGIICAAEDVLSWEVFENGQGENKSRVRLQLHHPLSETQPLRLMSSSCGLCGKQSWEDIFEDFPALPGSGENHVMYSEIPQMFEKMLQEQPVFQKTGAVHAAAVFDNQRQLLAIREDIGRHNAVDKVLGNLLLQDRLSQAAVLCVSGRVSFEILYKCRRAGISLLAAVSAPSALAVQLAQKAGITLLGFCRQNNFTVYTEVSKNH